MIKKGYFGIGIENTKTESNIGSLWRSAFLFGAKFIFTINRRYKRQCSDTVKTWKQIPLYHYETLDEFYKHIPYNCRLIGVETLENAIDILEYKHPKNCIYLLGSEDNGLTKRAIEKCHDIIRIPSKFSFNVSNTGSIIMYDKYFKLDRQG